MKNGLLIKGGLVMDGDGGRPFCADVLIRKGKIATIDSPETCATAGLEVYHARNRVVCPGFIDVHTHDDIYLLHRPDGEFKIRQGVTTVITGNCGISTFPIHEKYGSEAMEQLKLIGGDESPSGPDRFSDYVSYADALDRAGLGINCAGLVGHGMLRLAVTGPVDRALSNRETAQMRRLLELCLDSGAMGLSLGLIYAPGTYAGFKELLDLARIIKERNAIIAAHIRNEGGRVVESVEEMIHLARQSGAAVHISHHKAADPKNRGKSRQTLGLIDRAREEGLAITADAYPYRAGSTTLGAIIPSKALSFGIENLKIMLKDRTIRAKLKQEIEDDPLDRWQSLLTGQGEYRITIAHCRTRPDYVGKSLARLAEQEGKSPHDMVFDLVSSEGMGVAMVIHSMAQEDVQRILSHPAVMIGSDGIPTLGKGKPHPRLTGTFPRFLGKYAGKKGIVTLPEAVRKMTSLPADTFSLSGKGRLSEGKDADLVVFDPKTVTDRSTYEDPFQVPQGIDLVLVGGRPALMDGRITGLGRGGVIRKTN